MSVQEIEDDNIVDVAIEDTRIRPAVYDTESSGTAKMQAYTSQCGQTEADQISSGTSQHTIQAVVFKDVLRTIWGYYASGEVVEVDMPSLDVIGEVEQLITDVTIKQNAETKGYADERGVHTNVFDVQIQLKSPEAVEQASGG